MLKAHQNHFFNRFNQTIKCSTIMFGFLFIAACSSVSSESGSENKRVQNNGNNTPVIEKKGPYEQPNILNQPSVVSYTPPSDPLRFINEPIFKFNDKAYLYVLSPIASGYEKVVPKAVDKGISNFFYNLREPLYAVNHLLQGKFADSGKSLVRVLVNTTIGLAGLFDPAESLMKIERNKTTFGNTLASYGVGHGTYLVLPLLGPTDLRDTSSLAFNYFAHPLNFINDDTVAQQLLVVDAVHSQVPVLSSYPRVLIGTENKYEFVRNLYMQNLERDGQAKREETFNVSNKEE